MKAFGKIGVPYIALLMALVNLCSHTTVAFAGGFEPPSSNSAGFETILDPGCLSKADQVSDGSAKAIDSASKCKLRIQMFDWKYWNQTVNPDSSVCRQRHGNIVCFDANATEKLRWLNQEI